LGWEATWSFGGEQCWVEHDVSLRGGSGVMDERDGRLVLCLWLTACSCEHHCGHAHLHTFGRSSRRQNRPRGADIFKMEAKGQASKHPVYTDTYPYIISTTVNTTPVAERQ